MYISQKAAITGLSTGCNPHLVWTRPGPFSFLWTTAEKSHTIHAPGICAIENTNSILLIYGYYMVIIWLWCGYYIVIIWLLYGWWDILRYCSIPRKRWDIDGNLYIWHINGIYIYIHGILMGYYWLVGGWALPLWKMMEFVSWDDDIPNWMEK